MLVHVSPKTFLSRTSNSENSMNMAKMKACRVCVRVWERENLAGDCQSNLERQRQNDSWNTITSRLKVSWHLYWTGTCFRKEKWSGVLSEKGQQNRSVGSRADGASYHPQATSGWWVAFRWLRSRFHCLAESPRMQHMHRSSCHAWVGTPFLWSPDLFPL